MGGWGFGVKSRTGEMRGSDAMATAAHANLVGITGIARRLVMDGVLEEGAAREAMSAATEARKPLAQYLVDNRLVAPVQLVGWQLQQRLVEPAVVVARSVALGEHLVIGRAQLVLAEWRA